MATARAGDDHLRRARHDHSHDHSHDDTGSGVDCGELFGKLDLYLDRELSPPELARLERHFSECLPCTGRRDFEEQLRAVVRERCADQAPAELVELIRERLELPAD